MSEQPDPKPWECVACSDRFAKQHWYPHFTVWAPRDDKKVTS